MRLKERLRRLLTMELGVTLLGVSALLSATGAVVDDVSDRERIREQAAQIDDLTLELECRSVIAAEAQTIESQIDQATAYGLVAVATGNDQALIEQASRIEDLARQLGPAVERRANAVSECAEGENP